MRRDEIVEGDALHPGDPVVIDRYSTAARFNHWMTAASLVLLALSGLALFHPALYFLTGLFGGGSNTRAIHPWIGLFLFLGYMGLFFRFWKVNLWTPTDGTWLKKLHVFLIGHEEDMPEVGRYNFAQKAVFWWMGILIMISIASGLVIWEQYFAAYTTVDQKRWAVLIHSVAAIVMICIVIVHVYGALWARGTMTAMIKGRVTGGWAWRHHRKWLRELAADPKANRGTATPAE
ncbi:formate dehydrogenase subunit gamma [Rhodoplanes serenus]|jgi:formate dehydrogenase subunit gamma|uniref:Formate dehydrogenase subunit gamma n=1 Tax=Rhodoplanes serenus TaxID=200615 RepID=A0A327K1K8_9BRAD|nr:formate dehydrogenase subunit gamma [Rhodoplanes serenus]MBI5110532.1 formate dehydrogenase subunit gamma [Rhodovulum sp.]MTW16970.1 formate dehydrogenase subunit gamma [Rhodoplanes serenus]RAI31172.1 formate dehydrogenase subunit gamma [Rhodoplanes serenus]VCU11678.1 Formate dehydrogenase, cytochrome b556(fdo) subunit [Rhodoplanes serenus]